MVLVSLIQACIFLVYLCTVCLPSTYSCGLLVYVHILASHTHTHVITETEIDGQWSVEIGDANVELTQATSVGPVLYNCVV